MARDLGTKYVCFKCTTKFYDLKKPAPTCPKCGADQRDAPVVKPEKKGRGSAAAVAKDADEIELPATDEEEAEAEESDEEEDAAE